MITTAKINGDFHIHSVRSDGFFTPGELVLKLKACGINAAALTDHDTAGGVPEFMDCAAQAGILAVPGIEISAFEGFEIHILGYGIDISNPAFLKFLNEITGFRRERNLAILKKWKESYGFDLRLEELENRGGSTSRIHIARGIAAKGYMPDARTAAAAMREGRECYAEHFMLNCRAAIDAVHAAGGKAVLAHPYRIRLDIPQRRAFLKKLKSSGLDGIETYYKTHTNAGGWKRFAGELGLFVTAGGDFHGNEGDKFYPRVLPDESLAALGLTDGI